MTNADDVRRLGGSCGSLSKALQQRVAVDKLDALSSVTFEDLAARFGK